MWHFFCCLRHANPNSRCKYLRAEYKEENMFSKLIARLSTARKFRIEIRRVRPAIYAVAALFYTSAFTVQAGPVPPSSGTGWASLKSRIDPDVADVMADQKIVGMTVAASRNGKLVFSYGYGYAMKSGSKVTRMTQTKRTPIGSSGKALISGPATWRLARQRGLDPNKARLYGQNGILKGVFEADIKQASARFEHIAGMAIGRDDTVFTWYADGKVSRGWSRDLDSKTAREPFRPADGKTVRDIVGMAIAGSSGKVYTWYRDGSRSVGTTTDLDRYQPIKLDADGKPAQKVKLPKNLGMANIVGIAIRKSDDRVYVWYDNGTVSAGTSLDFARHFSNRSYSPPTRQRRYTIIDMGLSAEDQVYAWYSDKRTSTGTSTDLNAYRKLAMFKYPARGRIVNPYHKITLQQLLDHRTGFQRSGQIAQTALMYDRLEKNLKYRDAHRHFLATRSLLWEPGAGYSYSNHGFGLTTLIIPALSPSGRDYRDYTINKYLKPMGLKGTVRPRTANTDRMDSYIYDVSNGKVVPRQHSNSSLGLAAGGWSASAESILRITNYLTDRYSWDEVDQMGWGRSSKDALNHNGATGGGVSYVVMFPKGYVSRDGLSLSNIHVAITANTGGVSTGELKRLADKIALAIPVSGIPAGYSRWSKPAK
jgi:CubicO group peptidase (beta-lactamase class C family)